MNFPSAIYPREDYILEQVKAGNFFYSLTPIKYEEKGHVVEFYVMADALKIDGVRVNASARLLQKIADVTGLMMLTIKMADLVYNYTKHRIGPKPRSITSSTEGMIAHSRDVDAALSSLPGYDSSTNPLVDTVGKYWCLSNRLKNTDHRALTYGWHFTGNSYQGIAGGPCDSKLPYKVIQFSGMGHDDAHVDYSQTVRLVADECVVDGRKMKLTELMVDKDLCYLVSTEGPIDVFRQPLVPQDYDGPLVLPVVTITATGPTV